MVLVLVLVTVWLSAACTSGPSRESLLPTTATVSSAVSSTLAPTTLAPPTSIDRGEAEEGLRFDFGAVVAVSADGRWISFDRFQEYGTGRSGPDFTEEPMYPGATDVGFINQNPKLRDYRLADGVDVLLMDIDYVCESLDHEIEWFPLDLGELATLTPIGVSLTFSPDGQIIRIRDQRGC